MPVVRRHVRSKRRWHHDYLLAHLAGDRGPCAASHGERDPVRLVAAALPWLTHDKV